MVEWLSGWVVEPSWTCCPLGIIIPLLHGKCRKPLGLVPKTAGKHLHPRANMITAGMSATCLQPNIPKRKKYDKIVQNSSEFLYVVLDHENLLDSIGSCSKNDELQILWPIRRIIGSCWISYSTPTFPTCQTQTPRPEQYPGLWGLWTRQAK